MRVGAGRCGILSSDRVMVECHSALVFLRTVKSRLLCTAYLLRLLGLFGLVGRIMGVRSQAAGYMEYHEGQGNESGQYAQGEQEDLCPGTEPKQFTEDSVMG